VADRVLITGCTGFVARFVGPALRRHLPSARLIGATADPPTGSSAAFDEVRVVDLRDRAAVRALVEDVRPGAIVHLASRRDGDLADLLETNAVATDRLLEAVRDVAGAATRVVVVGSAAEIGECDPDSMPLREDVVCRPIDPYGISKLAQAGVCNAAHFRHGQNVIRVRCFNLIGPEVPAGLLPGRCVELLLGAKREGGHGPLAFRDLGTARDYVDVRDASRALALALERGLAGTLVHIGSGVARPGREVVERIFAEAERDVGRVGYEESVRSPLTVPIQVADIREAARALGWSPEISFEDSVRDLWRRAMGRAGSEAC
jgi:GDP-4-dehydro-6-deoxy-D-mannose reductase